MRNIMAWLFTIGMAKSVSQRPNFIYFKEHVSHHFIGNSRPSAKACISFMP
jgi:hypothetical protein